MPYIITYNKKDGGITIKYTGVVTDDEIIKNAKERFSSKDNIKKTRYYFHDFSIATEIKVTSYGVKIISEMAKNASKINNTILVVGILPTKLGYGMGRMWQGYTDEISWKTKIVRNFEDGHEWLHNNLTQHA